MNFNQSHSESQNIVPTKHSVSQKTVKMTL